MSQLALQDSDGDSLYYAYQPPRNDNGVTWVFFNALTGSAAQWQDRIVPALTTPSARGPGDGTLVWNYRGQAPSSCPDGVRLDDKLICADALRLLDHLRPPRPVPVGLSIGGLFAARVLLAEPAVKPVGLVFINTLRKPGPRLSWINEASLRCAEVGGLTLIKDLFAPLLFNPEWLAANRDGAFRDRPYRGLDPDSGHYRLLDDSRAADWALPYEQLRLPTLVLTGLQDRMFYVADDVAELAARLPDGRRVDCDDAGHMLPLERPDAFVDALLEFATALRP